MCTTIVPSSSRGGWGGPGAVSRRPLACPLGRRRLRRSARARLEVAASRRRVALPLQARRLVRVERVGERRLLLRELLRARGVVRGLVALLVLLPRAAVAGVVAAELPGLRRSIRHGRRVSCPDDVKAPHATVDLNRGPRPWISINRATRSTASP